MITIPAKGSLPRLNLGQAQLECPATRGRRALIALLSIRSCPKVVSVQRYRGFSPQNPRHRAPEGVGSGGAP